MKSGVVRRVDDLGRVVIPKEMRKSMGIFEGDPLEIYFDGDKLCLQKWSCADEHEKALGRIIRAIRYDDLLVGKTDKVVSLLEEACDVLHRIEKGGAE